MKLKLALSIVIIVLLAACTMKTALPMPADIHELERVRAIPTLELICIEQAVYSSGYRSAPVPCRDHESRGR
jgi:hypothetical protein